MELAFIFAMVLVVMWIFNKNDRDPPWRPGH